MVDIGFVVSLLKRQGIYKVNRKSWDNKNMYLKYVAKKGDLDAYIKIFLGDTFSIWAPTITDLLADDWQSIE